MPKDLTAILQDRPGELARGAGRLASGLPPAGVSPVAVAHYDVTSRANVSSALT